MADFGPRIRAARGWAGISQNELAKALGLDVQTVKRRENDPASKPKRAELIAIAQVCDVPLSFLENGFGGVTQSEISERLDSIAASVTLIAQVSSSTTGRDVNASALIPEGVLDRDVRGSQPKSRSRRQSQSPPEPDLSEGTAP